MPQATSGPQPLYLIIMSVDDCGVVERQWRMGEGMWAGNLLCERCREGVANGARLHVRRSSEGNCRKAEDDLE